MNTYYDQNYNNIDIDSFYRPNRQSEMDSEFTDKTIEHLDKFTQKLLGRTEGTIVDDLSIDDLKILAERAEILDEIIENNKEFTKLKKFDLRHEKLKTKIDYGEDLTKEEFEEYQKLEDEYLVMTLDNDKLWEKYNQKITALNQNY